MGGIPAQFDLNTVSNFMGFTVGVRVRVQDVGLRVEASGFNPWPE